MLDYIKMASNESTRVIITGLRGSNGQGLDRNGDDRGAVVGILKNEFSMAGQNTFNTALDVAENTPVFGKFIELQNKVNKFSKAISGVSAFTQSQSALIWDGSTKPQFTVEMEFLSTGVKNGTNDKLTIVEIMRRISSGALPRGTSKGGFLGAPLGYIFNKTQGRITLSVGKWFVATNLVMVSHNMVPSRETLKDGSPLTLSVSVTLEPAIAITYKNFEGYLKVR